MWRECDRRSHRGAGVAALRGRHAEQLLDLGLSEDTITYRVEIGRLRVIHRAVYAVGHSRLAPEGRWLAAVFAGGDDAALSHRSAARLWGPPVGRPDRGDGAGQSTQAPGHP